MIGCGSDSSQSGKGAVATSYKHGNEPSDSLTVGEFIDQPRNCRLPMELIIFIFLLSSTLFVITWPDRQNSWRWSHDHALPYSVILQQENEAKKRKFKSGTALSVADVPYPIVCLSHHCTQRNCCLEMRTRSRKCPSHPWTTACRSQGWQRLAICEEKSTPEF
jgi:hypothetical protein